MLKKGKVNLILITGKAGSGKDTVANILSHKLNASKFKFADRLKGIAYYMGWDQVKDSKGRKLLQNLGDAGREYDIDMWAKVVRNDILDIFPPEIAIVSDWRYENEKEFFVDDPLFNVITIRIVGRSSELSGGNSSHSSENSLTDNMKYDFKVNNAGSIIDLQNTIEDLYKDLTNG